MRDRETSTVFTASARMLHAAVFRLAPVLAAHTHFKKKETVVARPKKVIETKEKNLWGLGQRRRCVRSVILSRLLCWSKQRRICAPCVRKLLKIPRERAVTAERAVNPTSALQLNSRRVPRHTTQDESPFGAQYARRSESRSSIRLAGRHSQGTREVGRGRRSFCASGLGEFVQDVLVRTGHILRRFAPLRRLV